MRCSSVTEKASANYRKSALVILLAHKCACFLPSCDHAFSITLFRVYCVVVLALSVWALCDVYYRHYRADCPVICACYVLAFLD